MELLNREDFERVADSIYTLCEAVYQLWVKMIFPLSAVGHKLDELDGWIGHEAEMNHYALAEIEKLRAGQTALSKDVAEQLVVLNKRVNKLDPSQKISNQYEAIQSITGEIATLRRQMMSCNAKLEDVLEKAKMDNSFKLGGDR
jgi:hypothetical protein